MAAWSTSTDWYQRRLAAECDKCSRLELTVEQLAKQHRALETQFYSSYASLSNRPTSPLSDALRSVSPAFSNSASHRGDSHILFIIFVSTVISSVRLSWIHCELSNLIGYLLVGSYHGIWCLT